MEPRLRELPDAGERERRLFDLALRLEGLLRHASKHAAGIVISERPLTEDVPLWVDKDGAVVTAYSFGDIDAIGLIKFDFLGLKTLTLVESIVRRIREGRGAEVRTDRLPLDDAAAYQLLGAADTIGVFQLESGGIRRMLTQLRPSCFADLVAVLALYRPGPLDAKLDDGRTMAEVFIQRKCGKEPVRYLHPALEPILADTYGVIVYQEQVMQIAQALAGYSLGDADNLRRAMGKKKKEYMALERERFLAGVTVGFGLGAVKGVGSKAIEAILAARDEGPFTSMADFSLRVRGQLVNRRVIENLLKCGAFDSVERNRARLLAALDEVMRWAASRAEERASTQIGLFGTTAEAVSPPPLPAVVPWPADEELSAEREAIGFFITGHPLDRYEQDLRRFTTATTATLRTRGRELAPGEGERNGRPDTRPRVKLGGVIHSLRLKNSRKGDRYATFVLEDREGVVEVIAWPDTYRRHEAVVQGGAPVVVAGALEISDERCQVIADEILPLARAHAEAIRQVHVRVPLAGVGRDGLAVLKEVLAAHPGPCDTFLHLERDDDRETVLALPASLRVNAGRAIVNAVERLLGAGAMSFR